MKVRALGGCWCTQNMKIREEDAVLRRDMVLLVLAFEEHQKRKDSSLCT